MPKTKLESPAELTEKALAEAEGDSETAEQSEAPEAEVAVPALLDTSIITISDGGSRKQMRQCDYDDMKAAEAEALDDE